MTDLRETPCTCHPDDRPPVCQKRYAAGECIAAVTARNAALEEAATLIEERQTNNVGMVHPIAIADAAAIRALKEDQP